jgi:hypothetical protein
MDEKPEALRGKVAHIIMAYDMILKQIYFTLCFLLFFFDGTGV